MRIRTFSAPTISDAMALVREAMGDDAIILSTRQGRRGRGVEVRAAVEPAPDPAATRAVAATLDETAEIEARLRARLRAEIGGEPPGTAPQSRPVDQAVRPDLKPVGNALVFHRVPSALGKALLSDAKRFEVPTGRDALSAALETRFGFSPLPDVPTRPVLLVGPPGVGKTATAAKLAARALLAGGTVSLVTTDTVKAGGLAQIEAFADLLEIPCRPADTPEALRAVLSDGGGRGAIIDTPGTNPFNSAEREDLIGFVKAHDMEPVMVLAAGADLGDLVDTARIFQELGVRRVVFTRLDAARRLGSILWLMQSTGLCFAQGSRTPYLADGLMPLDPAALARLLLSAAATAGMPEASPPAAAASPSRPALKESSSS